MNITEWPIPKSLLDSPEVTNRNLLASKWCSSSVDEILNQYIKMTSQEAESFYINIFNKFPELELKGVGIELGAGVAALSAVAAKVYPSIVCIYAVELVPDVVRLLQSRTVEGFGTRCSSVVKPVIGSFDQISLPDNSVDFCIEFASLHHSHNLEKTLRELSRVIKPGGYVVAIDRAHHNSLTDGQIEYMLNVQYSDAWKKENGYSPAPLSRRQNGEHEYRVKKWESDFASASFKVVKRIELRKPGFKMFLRSVVLTLPFILRRNLNLLPSRVRPQSGEIMWRLLSLFGIRNSPIFTESTHDYTVFLARKQS